MVLLQRWRRDAGQRRYARRARLTRSGIEPDQTARIGPRLERAQIVGGLADPDGVDRNPIFLSQRHQNTAARGAFNQMSPVNFMDYRALSQAFDGAAAWWYPQLNLTEPGREPMRVNAVETSANLFAVIGVQPIVGEGFLAHDILVYAAIALVPGVWWLIYRTRLGLRLQGRSRHHHYRLQ